jgi:hypothetical protein
MLTIISEAIATGKHQDQPRAEINKRAGIFKFKINIKTRGSGYPGTATRWGADLTEAQTIEVLNACPAVCMRIDALTVTQWQTCPEFPGKYRHLELI